VRWQIRKARERGVTVHEVESENDFHFFYLLYLKSMIRNKAPAKYSQRMFKALRELVLSDLGSLFLAKVDGFPVAGHLVLYSDKVAHSMFVGSDDKYLKDFFPNKLLMHFVLSTAIDYGSEIFDFGGSDKDDLELIKFKKLWGGKEITTKTYVKDYSPIKCKVVEKVREWLFN
jgi:lipid II:glycine glycyltransferase (peptidoglycan interpeptide bridge formation enzyme)